MTLLADELRVYLHQECDIRELTDLDQDLVDRVRTRIRMILDQVPADQDAIDEATALTDLLADLARQRIDKILAMALQDVLGGGDPCLDGFLAAEKELYFAARESIWSCADQLGISFQEVPE